MQHVALVIGVRPHFVKLGALLPHLVDICRVTVIHSGQHYDKDLSGSLFDQLHLPSPDVSLHMETGSRTVQVGQVIQNVGGVLNDLEPDLVLIIGDTSTSVGGAVAAAELGILIGHIEAGITCGDAETPEEINRHIIASVTNIFLCPTPSAYLRAGGTAPAHFVGDLLLDMAIRALPDEQESAQVLDKYGLHRGEFIFATIHRASNLKSKMRCENIVRALSSTPQPVLFSLHPGSRLALEKHHLMDQLVNARNVTVVPPLPYRNALVYQKHARLVVSDSNGIQRESYFLGTPCVILRPNTEYMETVDLGGAVLCDPVDLNQLSRHIERQKAFTPRLEVFGDGYAAARIAAAIDQL